tara:strand:+ start:788 stop:1063 length:276 start_codon:yes stop_codon:yes gene_type:complete
MENPELKKTVIPDNDLKNMLIEYVGERLSPHDKNVTVEMIIEVMAAEFPQFLLVIAEENWIRGYQQAIDDVDSGMSLAGKQSEENNKLLER